VGQQERGEPVKSLSLRSGGGAGTAGTARLVASIESVEITGGLAADLVLQKVRSRGLTLRECAGPSAAPGSYTLVLAIAPTGAVSSVTATGGAAEVHACLATQLRKLTFAKASAETRARLRLDLVPR
jgi:hypothetical protein